MNDVTTARLDLTRDQILAYRLSVNGLTERQPLNPTSLRRAAWAGLQDSMPRAAVLSLHARIQDVGPAGWEDPSLVQLWGPRWSAYVVPARDLAVFSLGRLPGAGKGRRVAEDLAGRLDAFLDGRRMPYGEAGDGLGEVPNRLRYAAATGRVLIRWEGARQPVIWTVPAPEVDPGEARLELARRYLHVFGPGTTSGFAGWAGIAPADGAATFDALAGSLTPVRTPVGDRLILTADESTFRSPGGPVASARLLPSGDAYFLQWGASRELLVPAAVDRQLLWTSRVWPGAVLMDAEIVGTWRRAQGDIAISSWRRLSPSEREAIEAEAAAMPLADIQQIRVRWDV
jgi:Winged helix DNA-binding domain